MIPQKKDINIFYQLAFFSSGGLGNSHMGPGLENRVDGARQLLFHLRDTLAQWQPCAKEHYGEV